MGETRGSTNRSYPSPKETTLHTQYQNQALYQWSIADAHHLNLGIGHILDELELTINSKIQNVITVMLWLGMSGISTINGRW